MPRLRQYTNGNGYYVKGYLHGVGHCTWQIAEEGLAYLRVRGISRDGDHLSDADRKALHEQGLIWHTGEGDRLPQSANAGTLVPELALLASELGRWARVGGIRALTALLYSRAMDHRDRCFSLDFLRWLSRLDSAIRLTHLDELSASDFDDFAGPNLSRLSDPLHNFFAAQGDTHVLWQLARIVGLVARQRRGSSVCPAVWETEQPVLQRLFALLGQMAVVDLDSPGEGKRYQPRRRGLLRRPLLLWEVDLQQVVAVLPEQVLPADVERLTWSVSPGDCEQPSVWPVDGGRQVGEAFSHALPPAPSYQVTLDIRRQGEIKRQECMRFSLPDDFSPCVLFRLDGTLVPFEGETCEKGEYLALLKADCREDLFRRWGVRAVEGVPVAPVGWYGWEGWRVALAPGASVAPYQIDACAGTANWELEPPPPAKVVWQERQPVWLGDWPRLFLSETVGFAGAILEIHRENSVGPAEEPLRLTLGDKVPVSTDGTTERPFLDLGRLQSLQGIFGHLRLECRLPASPERPPLQARFVRLPALHVRYVPDLRDPQRHMAVELGSPDGVLPEVLPNEDTEASLSANAVVLCARQPVHTPGVTARLPQYWATVRLRVPTTRVAFISKDKGFSEWQSLPIDALDLAKVGIKDFLRVELTDSPYTEAGRLLCRLVGRGEVAAGDRLLNRPGLNVFEIELHRWRDTLGLSATGVVQVRGHRNWIDLARLRAPSTDAVPPPAAAVPPTSVRSRLLQQLDLALNQAAWGDAQRLVCRCLDLTRQPDATAVDRELLPIAAARALTLVAVDPEPLQLAWNCLTEVAEREDLPEARLLRETLALRLHCRSGGYAPMSRDGMLQIEHRLPDSPRKQLLLSECYYHLARGSRWECDAYWQACLELSVCFLSSTSTADDVPERREARLLRELAHLMLAREPVLRPGDEDAAPLSDSLFEPWISAAREAARYTHNLWRPGRQRISARARQACHASIPQVLRPEDENLLCLIIAQAEHRESAVELWKRVKDWPSERFFGIRLLSARQAVLEGRLDDARCEYGLLLEEALERGQYFFLDIVAGERPA